MARPPPTPSRESDMYGVSRALRGSSIRRGNVKHTRSSTIADLNLQFERVKRKYEPAPVSDARHDTSKLHVLLNGCHGRIQELSEITLSHHSTPVMIYITVHCPFPALTFQQQMAFNFKTGDVNQHGVKLR